MPFLTEDLWQQLPRHPEVDRPESIMIADYPAANKAWSSDEVEADMDDVLSIKAKTRSMRSGTLSCTWLGFTLPGA